MILYLMGFRNPFLGRLDVLEALSEQPLRLALFLVIFVLILSIFNDVAALGAGWRQHADSGNKTRFTKRRAGLGAKAA